MQTKQKIKLSLSLLFLFFSLSFTGWWVKYTNSLYPNLTVNEDVFFKILPFINLSVILDVLSIVGPILFLIFIFRNKVGNKVPYYAVSLGIFYLIRSFFIYVTPLANPFPLDKWGLNLFPVGGMFPSGHVGIIFLMYFLIKEEKSNSKYWAITLLAIGIIEALFMVISRGHYTLDVLGAIIIVYALHCFSRKHLRKKFV